MESFSLNQAIQNKSTSKLFLAADKKILLNENAVEAYEFGILIAKESDGREIHEIWIDELEGTFLLVFFGSEQEVIDKVKDI